MSKVLQLKIITALQDKLTAPLRKIRGESGESARSIKTLRDKLKDLEQTQKDIGKFRNLSKGLSETSTKMHEAQNRANALAAQMKATSQPTSALQREFKQATRTADALKNKHAQQAQELQRLRSSLSNAGISTKSLSRDERDLRQNITRTTHELEAQRKKLAQVAQQQRKLGEARQKMERVQSMAGSMAATGAVGMATGTGALYAGARFMSVGVDFDASMSKVQSLARLDKDSDEMKALREQARRLGAETAFSATEAAAGQGFLAMAGFDPQSIIDAMPGLLDMAKAGGNELAETADIASNILTGFSLKASEMGRVGDVLVGTFTRSNVDLGMLGETMKYAAPIASSLSQDIETVAAMAGKLGDAGIQGGMAGTALRSIMNRLSAPPKSAAEAIEKLGLVTADAAGNLRPMPDILKDIYDKTQHMGDTERAGLMKAIAGEEAVSALQVLAQQAGTGELQKFIQTLIEAEGESSRTAKVMADNLVGDLDEMRSAWEDLGIGIQEQQNGPMRDLVKRVTGIIRSVSEWANANPELVAKLVQIAAVIAALVAVGGALMVTLASILGPLAMLRYGMTLLSVQGGGLFSAIWGIGAKALPFLAGAFKSLTAVLIANPIGATIAAIAVAALLIWKYWNPVKEFFAGLWRQIKIAFDGGIAGITALLVNWSPLGLVYKAFAAVLSYIGIDVPATLSDAGAKLLLGFSAAVKPTVASLWAEIKAGFDGGILGVSALIANWSPIGLFYQAFASVMNYLGVELPSKFTEFGSMIMSGLVKGIKSMAGSVKDSVVGIGESTIGWFKEKLGIQSPSRIFMGFGENISEGAAIGINNKSDMVAKAAQALTAGALAMGAISPTQSAAIADMQSGLQPISLPPLPDVLNTVNVAAPVVRVAAPSAAPEPAIRPALQTINLPPLPDVLNTVNVGEPVVHVAAPVINFSQPEMEFENIRFDDRPPITTKQVNQQTSYQQSSQYQSNAGDKIEIHIHAAPGQKEVDIARAVAAELDRREREKLARQRSGLFDY